MKSFGTEMHFFERLHFTHLKGKLWNISYCSELAPCLHVANEEERMVVKQTVDCKWQYSRDKSHGIEK